tara:strand:+ start:352 stop:564 length:213 start_codon:yes stop_codon:yes gene_type:complete
MARYSKEEKALMTYALCLMKGETEIWNKQTHKKLSNLINKVDTPFYNGTGMYDESYLRYQESWEAEGIYD